MRGACEHILHKKPCYKEGKMRKRLLSHSLQRKLETRTQENVLQDLIRRTIDRLPGSAANAALKVPGTLERANGRVIRHNLPLQMQNKVNRRGKSARG